MTGVINSAHANRTRVVLTVQSFAWSSSGVTRQKALLGSASRPRQPRPPDRGRRARSRRRRRQSRLRADRVDLCRRVRRARAHASRRAQQGRQGLPADVRHERLDRQLSDRGRHRRRGSRRRRRHGLRLPGRVVEDGRLGRADRRLVVRRDRHGQGLCRSRARVQGHPRRPVLRPRLVDRQLRAPRQEHLGHQERLVGDRRVRRRPRLRPPARPQVGRRGRRGLDVVPAPELHGGVRLRQPVARDLLRRSAGARAQVRRHQPLQPAWRGHLGARLRRVAARALPGAQGQVRHRHHPAQDQQRDAQHADHLAQRRRAARHDDDPGQRHRPRQVRLDRPAGVGKRDRSRRSHRVDDRPAGGLHVVRLEQRGRRRAERSLPDHDLDRGRLQQSRVDLAGTSRSIGGPPSSACRPARRPSRPTATADPIARPSG